MVSQEFQAELDRFRNDYESLVHAIEDRKVVFFVGSGISRATPTNIETARELSQKFQERYGQYDWWRAYFDPDNLTHDQEESRLYDDGLPRLEEIAELFLQREEFNEFINALESRAWEAKPANVCHEVLAELLIEEICNGIITTNLDDQVEKIHRDRHTKGPNIVSHDDFLAQRGQNNNIYKIHGCLYRDQTKKYESIWATSQLRNGTWPAGVTFGDSVIRDYGTDHAFIFVGFASCPEYLKNTMQQIVGNRDAQGRPLECYCVINQTHDEMLREPAKASFAQSIALVPERHYTTTAEDFFCIIRQIVFEDRLRKLFQDDLGPRGENFQSGSSPCWQVAKAEYDTAKDQLKAEIISTDREKYQKFLRMVIFDESYGKFVSFGFDGHAIARVLFLLVLLRLNYSFIFCESPFHHLTIRKDGFEARLIFKNGHDRVPLSYILQELNQRLAEDEEMQCNIRNVFVYDPATIDCDPRNPHGVGIGKIVVEEPGKIADGYAVNYSVLLDDDLYGFLRGSNLEQFCQRLDVFSWR